MMDTCYLYICQNPKNKNVQHQEQTLMSTKDLRMMCQCRLIACNKCTTLVWDADSGGTVSVRGCGTQDISVLSTQLSCESKTSRN